MEEREIIDLANKFTVRRILELCFPSNAFYGTSSIAGVVITVERSRRRTGIPPDATCCRYVFTNVVEGWSLVARTVWLNGRLYEPVAVHTQIDHYFDDNGGFSDNEFAVAEAVNEWFRKLSL